MASSRGFCFNETAYETHMYVMCHMSKSRQNDEEIVTLSVGGGKSSTWNVQLFIQGKWFFKLGIRAFVVCSIVQCRMDQIATKTSDTADPQLLHCSEKKKKRLTVWNSG